MSNIVHQTLLDEQGFTLAELSVATLLGLLLLGFLFLAFNQLTKSMRLWQREVQLENIAHQTTRYLQKEIQSADAVWVSEKRLSLYFLHKKRVEISFSTQKIFKNDTPVLPQEISCLRFIPTIQQADSTQQFKATLLIQFTLSNPIDTIQVAQRFLIPRNQAWQ